jgi:phage baseplate assembly protein W
MANPSREIDWPFHIGATGGVAVVEDRLLIAYKHLLQLISTRLGERLMQPRYGTVASAYLFESNDPVTATELAIRIRAAINTWAPNVVVVSIKPQTDVNEGQMFLDIAFTIPPSTQTFTTVVGVGGNLIGTENG